MKSAWATRDADAAVARYADIPPDLALRVYSTRLLGADPKLVLHGGGNTSLKTRVRDLNGDETDVLYVKGSGSDMASIEPAGFAAVRLAPLLKLRTRDMMPDDEFIRIPRANLIDPAAPSPSVELMLHAFMPATFIDHTHATAVLSLTNQPNGEQICREVYGDRLGLVPYRMPGFGLARTAADVFDANNRVEGLILLTHGIFTFGCRCARSLRAHDRVRDACGSARREETARHLLSQGCLRVWRHSPRSRRSSAAHAACLIPRPKARGRGSLLSLATAMA